MPPRRGKRRACRSETVAKSQLQQKTKIRRRRQRQKVPLTNQTPTTTTKTMFLRSGRRRCQLLSSFPTTVKRKSHSPMKSACNVQRQQQTVGGFEIEEAEEEEQVTLGKASFASASSAPKKLESSASGSSSSEAIFSIASIAQQHSHQMNQKCCRHLIEQRYLTMFYQNNEPSFFTKEQMLLIRGDLDNAFQRIRREEDAIRSSANDREKEHQNRIAGLERENQNQAKIIDELREQLHRIEQQATTTVEAEAVQHQLNEKAKDGKSEPDKKVQEDNLQDLHKIVDNKNCDGIEKKVPEEGSVNDEKMASSETLLPSLSSSSSEQTVTESVEPSSATDGVNEIMAVAPSSNDDASSKEQPIEGNIVEKEEKQQVEEEKSFCQGNDIVSSSTSKTDAIVGVLATTSEGHPISQKPETTTNHTIESFSNSDASRNEVLSLHGLPSTPEINSFFSSLELESSDRNKDTTDVRFASEDAYTVATGLEEEIEGYINEQLHIVNGDAGTIPLVSPVFEAVNSTISASNMDDLVAEQSLMSKAWKSCTIGSGVGNALDKSLPQQLHKKQFPSTPKPPKLVPYLELQQQQQSTTILSDGKHQKQLKQPSPSLSFSSEQKQQPSESVTLKNTIVGNDSRSNNSNTGKRSPPTIGLSDSVQTTTQTLSQIPPQQEKPPKAKRRRRSTQKEVPLTSPTVPLDQEQNQQHLMLQTEENLPYISPYVSQNQRLLFWQQQQQQQQQQQCRLQSQQQSNDAPMTAFDAHRILPDTVYTSQMLNAAVMNNSHQQQQSGLFGEERAAGYSDIVNHNQQQHQNLLAQQLHYQQQKEQNMMEQQRLLSAYRHHLNQQQYLNQNLQQPTLLPLSYVDGGSRQSNENNNGNTNIYAPHQPNPCNVWPAPQCTGMSAAPQVQLQHFQQQQNVLLFSPPLLPTSSIQLFQQPQTQHQPGHYTNQNQSYQQKQQQPMQQFQQLSNQTSITPQQMLPLNQHQMQQHQMLLQQYQQVPHNAHDHNGYKRAVEQGVAAIQQQPVHLQPWQQPQPQIPGQLQQHEEVQCHSTIPLAIQQLYELHNQLQRQKLQQQHLSNDFLSSSQYQQQSQQQQQQNLQTPNAQQQLLQMPQQQDQQQQQQSNMSSIAPEATSSMNSQLSSSLAKPIVVAEMTNVSEKQADADGAEAGENKSLKLRIPRFGRLVGNPRAEALALSLSTRTNHEADEKAPEAAVTNVVIKVENTAD